jgi:hypothetical protein
MRNVTAKVVGNKLTIEVDLSQAGHASASGKSMVIGSTEGNVEIPGSNGLILGVNAYRRNR